MSLQNRPDSSAANHSRLDERSPEPRYTLDTLLCDLDFVLKGFAAGWQLELEQEDQHNHGWSLAQQVVFIERLLRGKLSDEERLLRFNCPHWDGECPSDLPHRMQIVDGAQRLAAIRRFLCGEVRAFGMSVGDFNGTRYDIRRTDSVSLRLAIHALPWRRDLLQFYLDINSGRTPQRDVVIARVRSHLRQIDNRSR